MLTLPFLKSYHCAVPTALLSLPKPQAWTPIVDQVLISSPYPTFIGYPMFIRKIRVRTKYRRIYFLLLSNAISSHKIMSTPLPFLHLPKKCYFSILKVNEQKTFSRPFLTASHELFMYMQYLYFAKFQDLEIAIFYLELDSFQDSYFSVFHVFTIQQMESTPFLFSDACLKTDSI